MRKVKSATREIMSCGSTDIMKKIELAVCIRLHEKVTIPMMLYNSETWTLTKSDLKEVEKMELWALKWILNVPRTTPSVAIRFVTGTLYADIRIDERQLMYLQKILKREESHWTHHLLKTLDMHSIGWAQQIRIKLREYELDEDWERIRNKGEAVWKRQVKQAIEKRHKAKLHEECHSVRGDKICEKTKTLTIIPSIESEDFNRTRDYGLMTLTIIKARAIIMGRYMMLDCANNFENKYGSKKCDVCNVIDDEIHRINYCPKWESINYCDNDEQAKIDFSLIYSDKKSDLEETADVILSIWDLKNGKNSMIQN